MKLLFALIATTLIQLSSCWWENGHMLAAQVAEILLQRDHKNVYDRANQIVLSMSNLAYDYDNTFVTSAVWADDIKDAAMNFWEPWHFYGRPVNPEGIYLMQDQIQADSNALNALERAMLELDDSNGKEITLQKAFFMRFLIHIVGDVHQPLHSAQLFNETFSGPYGDMGGNLEDIITPEGTTEKLHAFWDQGAQYFQKEGENWIWRPFNQTTKVLMKEWAQDLMDEFPAEELGDLIKISDPVEWTRESWQIASDFIYPGVANSNQLTEDYQTEAQQICKKRVVLAGYRLANALVSLYKDWEPEQGESPAKDVELEADNIFAQWFESLKKGRFFGKK